MCDGGERRRGPAGPAAGPGGADQLGGDGRRNHLAGRRGDRGCCWRRLRSPPRRRGGVAAARSSVPPSRVVGAGVAGGAPWSASGLRSRSGYAFTNVRHHPIADRYGSVAAVVVTPSESPRSLGGSRMMFRGSLQALDENEISGRVVVFAPVLGLRRADRGPTGELPRPHRPADPPRPDRRGAVGDGRADTWARPHRSSGPRTMSGPVSPTRRARRCPPTRRRCCPRWCSATPRR